MLAAAPWSRAFSPPLRGPGVWPGLPQPLPLALYRVWPWLLDIALAPTGKWEVWVKPLGEAGSECPVTRGRTVPRLCQVACPGWGQAGSKGGGPTGCVGRGCGRGARWGVCDGGGCGHAAADPRGTLRGLQGAPCEARLARGVGAWAVVCMSSLLGVGPTAAQACRLGPAPWASLAFLSQCPLPRAPVRHLPCRPLHWGPGRLPAHVSCSLPDWCVHRGLAGPGCMLQCRGRTPQRGGRALGPQTPSSVAPALRSSRRPTVRGRCGCVRISPSGSPSPAHVLGICGLPGADWAPGRVGGLGAGEPWMTPEGSC